MAANVTKRGLIKSMGLLKGRPKTINQFYEAFFFILFNSFIEI